MSEKKVNENVEKEVPIKTDMPKQDKNDEPVTSGSMCTAPAKKPIKSIFLALPTRGRRVEYIDYSRAKALQIFNAMYGGQYEIQIVSPTLNWDDDGTVVYNKRLNHLSRILAGMSTCDLFCAVENDLGYMPASATPECNECAVNSVRVYDAHDDALWLERDCWCTCTGKESITLKLSILTSKEETDEYVRQNKGILG